MENVEVIIINDQNMESEEGSFQNKEENEKTVINESIVLLHNNGTTIPK